MLILTRKPGQGICIGNDIQITVKEINGNQVRLGIEAAPAIKVYRSEIYEQIIKENISAASAGGIKFNSTRFGSLEVKEDKIIDFPVGIIGISEAERFVLLDYNPPFSWLHSVDNPEVAFVVVNGAEFGKTYQIEMPYGDRDIDLKPNDEFALINVVTVQEDVGQTAVNMRAPIIVNLRNKKGKQFILEDENMPLKLFIFDKEQAA